MLKHPKQLDAAIKELASQLNQVRNALSPRHLQELEKVHFWFEWNSRPKGAAEVYVSKDWLKENGYDPDKWIDVEIGNLVNFVEWSQKEQPWMVMHELTHA